MKNLLILVGVFLLGITSCSFSKQKSNPATPTVAQPNPSPSETQRAPDAASLQITDEDWIIEQGARGKASSVVKTLKSEKLDTIRKHFRVPKLSAITVPESNGFEIYQISGYPEMESSFYIHPKVYINSGNNQGQVLGFKTGKKDPAGKDLIEISIPIALVNGLVPSVPVQGGVQNGGGAVTLPAQYQIPDAALLKTKLGGERTLTTLPVCPRLFRLIFQKREYWATSPFEHLSACPLNQFFRISFQAPVDEMQELLETAAIRDEVVSLLSSLRVGFDVPKQIVDLSFSNEDFAQSLQSHLTSAVVSGTDSNQQNGYLVQDIEGVVLDSVFDLAREAGLEPRLSSAILNLVPVLVSGYFSTPFSCAAGGICRSLLARPIRRDPVGISWMQTDQLAAALDTETVTYLGAVANTSEFSARPAQDQLAQVRRPIYFRGKPFNEVLRECSDLASAGYAFNPETTEDGKLYLRGYCDAMIANGLTNEGDPNLEDGFYPLGSNTVVYPGAWLKIDLNDISEFTTAKTRSKPDGTIAIESEVRDLLAQDPNAKRTQCIVGNGLACLEYRTKQTPVRAPNGAQIYSDVPCERGEPGCTCNPNSNGSQNGETCSRRQVLSQTVLDYACNPADEYEYCPYWRNEDQVVDFETEWECKSVKVVDRTTFLCIGGCYTHEEVKCEQKSKKPVLASRQRLNCREDDPVGSAMRERVCRAPKYKCKRWEMSCSKYTVNEVFQVIHEEIAPKWRPFAIQKGEYPKRFEEDIELRFVSPGRTVNHCKLNRFPREFRGNSIFIKMPSDKNEGIQPCEEPLWDERNTQPLYLPKVYIRNGISFAERRLCGRTEYSFSTKEVPLNDGDGLIPPEYSYKTQTTIGPIREACRSDSPFQIGSDLWFTEYPPIRFSGRVSVLGRVLESIVTEKKP